MSIIQTGGIFSFVFYSWNLNRMQWIAQILICHMKLNGSNSFFDAIHCKFDEDNVWNQPKVSFTNLFHSREKENIQISPIRMSYPYQIIFAISMPLPKVAFCMHYKFEAIFKRGGDVNEHWQILSPAWKV